MDQLPGFSAAVGGSPDWNMVGHVGPWFAAEEAVMNPTTLRPPPCSDLWQSLPRRLRLCESCNVVGFLEDAALDGMTLADVKIMARVQAPAKIAKHTCRACFSCTMLCQGVHPDPRVQEILGDRRVARRGPGHSSPQCEFTESPPQNAPRCSRILTHTHTHTKSMSRNPLERLEVPPIWQTGIPEFDNEHSSRCGRGLRG